MSELHPSGITDVYWKNTKDDDVKNMKTCADKARQALSDLAPIIRIQNDSNICSSVYVSGSYDPIEKHTYGIFENSKYFVFSIMPAKGKRYHKENGEVTVELRQSHHSLPRFRKSTTTEEKAILRIFKWITDSRPDGKKHASDWIKASREQI